MSITEHLAKLEAIAGKACPNYQPQNWDAYFLLWLHSKAGASDREFIAMSRTELPKLCAALKLLSSFVENIPRDCHNESDARYFNTACRNRLQEIAAILGAQQETKP